MSFFETPDGFEQHDYALRESDGKWVIGELPVPSDQGVLVHAAAFNKANGDMLLLKPTDFDDESYTFTSFELLHGSNTYGVREDRKISEFPHDVVQAIYNVMDHLVVRSGATISPDVEKQITGSNHAIDQAYSEAIRGFDPSTLLEPAPEKWTDRKRGDSERGIG